MKQYIVALFFLLGIRLFGQTWYVSGNGSDSNDGKSRGTAFSACNGGAGFHTVRIKQVDIFNGTTYRNGSNVDYPEMFASSSEDITFLNNIISPKPAGKVISSINKNSNIKWNCILYPVSLSLFNAANDIVANTHFVNRQSDLLKADFRLIKGSKCSNRGINERPPLSDIAGHSRI